jgi:ribokinase
MTPADIEAMRAVYLGAACALFQLETPLPAVEAAMSAARAAGARTILDPAPAQPLPAFMLSLVDILTPNESEACILLGREPGRVTFDEAPELAGALRALGMGSVVLKLGDQGCFYAGPEGEFALPGFAVQAVDTTAAGDTFNAGFAVALAEGMNVASALQFANAAAAISVTRLGAQASAPSRAEVDALIISQA